MKLSVIVAMTEERVIGNQNQLPWHISEDLKRFKQLTMGKTVIMGRKTFESIGKPLPGRTNVVISRNRSFQAPGVKTASDLESALSVHREEDEVFVIGGSSLYETALPKADRIYLTMVHKGYDGDVHFPDVNLKKLFGLRKEGSGVTSEGIPYTFFVGDRITN